MLRIIFIGGIGILLIAAMVTAYILLGRSEKRDTLQHDIDDVTKSGDEALLLMLEAAESDKEKEEILRFAKEAAAANAATTAAEAEPESPEFAVGETAEAEVAADAADEDEAVEVGEVEVGVEADFAAEAEAEAEAPEAEAAPLAKPELSTLPIFEEKAAPPAFGVEAALREIRDLPPRDFTQEAAEPEAAAYGAGESEQDTVVVGRKQAEDYSDKTLIRD